MSDPQEEVELVGGNEDGRVVAVPRGCAEWTMGARHPERHPSGFGTLIEVKYADMERRSQGGLRQFRYQPPLTT